MSGYKYVTKSDQTLVYDGKDKSAWYLLLAEKGLQLKKQKIDYIKDEGELLRRSTEPIPPMYIPYNGPMPEPIQHMEARKHLMNRMNKDYDVAKFQWAKDTRQIEDDFGIATTILMDHVSPAIKKSLQAELAEAERRGENNRGKYNSLWNKLRTDHGPYSQQDVENMRNEINTIDMDALGVKDAIQLFKESVLSMSMTPIRDGNGQIMYEPSPINEAALPPKPPGGANMLVIANYWNALQAEEALAAARQGAAMTHAPNDEQIKTYLKNMLQRSKLPDFHKIYVDSLLPLNHGWTHQQMMTDIETLSRHEDQGINLGGPNSKLTGTRFIGVIRHATTSESGRFNERRESRKRDRSNESRHSGAVSDAYNILTCTNCKGDHNVRDCLSTKCGHCGLRFDSVRERKSHWGKDHAKQPYNKSRGSGNNKYTSSGKRSGSPYPRKHSSNRGRNGYHSDTSNHSTRSNNSKDYYRDRNEDKSNNHSYTNSSKERKHYKQHSAKHKESDNESERSASTKESKQSYQKHN